MMMTLKVALLVTSINLQWGGLDFLYTDLELMIDVFYQSLTSHVIKEHEHFEMLFELAHAIYAVLKALQNKYILRISEEE